MSVVLEWMSMSRSGRGLTVCTNVRLLYQPSHRVVTGSPAHVRRTKNPRPSLLLNQLAITRDLEQLKSSNETRLEWEKGVDARLGRTSEDVADLHRKLDQLLKLHLQPRNICSDGVWVSDDTRRAGPSNGGVDTNHVQEVLGVGLGCAGGVEKTCSASAVSQGTWTEEQETLPMGKIGDPDWSSYACREQ